MHENNQNHGNKSNTMNHHLNNNKCFGKFWHMRAHAM